MLGVSLAGRIVNCISVTFFCVTVPFYVFLLSIITYEYTRKNRDFASPFYILSITTGVIDVVTLLNNYFGSVFPKWCWIKEFYLSSEQFWLHLYFFLAWGTGASQALCTSLIALNRLSGVLLGERYSKMWNSTRVLLSATFVQVVPGVALSAMTFRDRMRYTVNDAGCIVPVIISPIATDTYWKIAMGFLFSNATFVACLYATLFVKVRRHSFAAKTSKMNRRRHLESRLFTMSSIVCGVQFALVAFVVIRLLVNIPTDTFYLIYNLLSDLYSGINPYLLWTFSPPLRSRILRMLRLRKAQTPVIFFTTSARNTMTPKSSMRN